MQDFFGNYLTTLLPLLTFFFFQSLILGPELIEKFLYLKNYFFFALSCPVTKGFNSQSI
jgi:hypothetical protein